MVDLVKSLQKAHAEDLSDELMGDAADEITRLREENARIHKALESIRDGYGPNHLSKYARDVAAAAIRSLASLKAE